MGKRQGKSVSSKTLKQFEDMGLQGKDMEGQSSLEEALLPSKSLQQDEDMGLQRMDMARKSSLEAVLLPSKSLQQDADMGLQRLDMVRESSVEAVLLPSKSLQQDEDMGLQRMDMVRKSSLEAVLLPSKSLQQDADMGLQRLDMVRESSVEAVLRDYHLVSTIVAFLHRTQDRLSAALVCRRWNDAVIHQSHRISARYRSLLPYFSRGFRHITVLDLSFCSDQLQNQDLLTISKSFPDLHTLTLGHPDSAQQSLSDDGFRYLADGCKKLGHLSLCVLPRITDTSICSIADGCAFLKSISMENCRGLSNYSLESISRCKNLEEICLKGWFQFTLTRLAFSPNGCPHLRKARFELGSLDIAPLLNCIASRCPKIQELSLKGNKLDLNDLVKCSTLTCLRLETDERRRVDDVLIAIATRNKNLTELTLINHFAPLNDASICEIIRICKKLEKLHIEAVHLTEASLLFLMECKTLKSLALNHFRSSGSGLAEIGLCGLELIEFSLRNGRSIRDVELQTLMQGNQTLQHLDLQGCHGPSTIGFSAIGGCSNLLSLDLGFTNVDDLSLMAISSGTKLLRHLSLVKCEAIIDAGVISCFTSLESLNIDQCCSLSDKGLDSIAQSCSSLTHLSLAYTRITDEGLSYLTKCSYLRSLRIPYCKGVQGPGIVAIANNCAWFQYISLSHHFRGTKTVVELETHHCILSLEVDDMALVPFDFNI